MTLTEKIQTALIGADFPGIQETEDQYVMRACFSTEHDEYIVRVYYGDVTEEIGYVDVDEPGV